MSLLFADCELDFEAHELRRGGAVVHLTPKAFALLELLARERPRAVARQQILDALWPGAYVGEGSIAVAVAEVRRALGDSGSDGHFVRTIRGFGYSFCAAEASASAAGRAAGAVCRLVAWGLEQHWLAPGSYLIGRDASCDVRLDVAGLSRRHARLFIGPQGATIEDLASKNGSFCNGVRLAPEHREDVREGDEIRLGSVVLSLHWLPYAGATETVGGADRADPGA